MASLKEQIKLKAIQKRLETLDETLETVSTIFHMVNKKKLNIELEIKLLTDERDDILRGQLIFDVLKEPKQSL